MSRTLTARLRKLEATRTPAARSVILWGWGKTEEEIEAEKAELVRLGRASTSDHFMVFTWMSNEMAQAEGGQHERP
jgi:hypothetical protein